MSIQRLRDERGFTALEMVATLLILGIVLSMTLGAVTSGLRAHRGAELRLENLAEAQTIVNNMTKELRTATRLDPVGSPFVKAAPFEVIFYANFHTEAGPRKIRLYLDDGNRLIREITEPDEGSVAPNYTYTGEASARILGFYVANPTDRPIFEYFDESGEELAPDSSGELPAADRVLVEAVGITLSIRRDTLLSVAPTTVLNRVRLPNVNYNPIVES